MAEYSNLEKVDELLPMSLRETTPCYDVDKDNAPLVEMEDGEHNTMFQLDQNEDDDIDKGLAPPPIPNPDYEENEAFEPREDYHDDEGPPLHQLSHKMSTAPLPPPSVTPSLPSRSAAPSTSVAMEVEVEESLNEANKTKATHKEELMFRMRMAHLAPRGVNWGEELHEACEGCESSEIPDQVLDSLREFPMNMSEKLSLSAHLRGKQTRQTPQNGVSVAKRNRASQIGSSVAVVSDVLYKDSFGTLGFWDKPIGKIGAQFGTNVASYFKFLRFIAVINAWSAVLMFCFVSLPQIIPNEVISYGVHPGFFAKFSQTIFFYGAYSNTSLNEGDSHDSALLYNRPLAYFLTWSSVYILSILFIVLIMYASYKRSKQSFSDASSRYSAALLVGWDHSVTTKEGCRLEASAFSTYVREMTIEDRERKKLTCGDRFVLTLVRVVSNFMCLAIMGGSGYFIYYVADQSTVTEEDVSGIKDFFQKYQLTILVSALKIVIPPVLSLLLFFERWHPRTNIKLQLARTAVFYAASLLSFLISVYSMSTKCEENSVNATTTTTTSTTPQFIITSTISPANGTDPKNEGYCCWENEVGQQIFQVVILDLVVNVGVALVTMAGRAVIVEKCFSFRMLGHAEFKVPSEILDLVYSQSLIWLGLYTAPFMALVGFIKLIAQFYFFYTMATHFCESPSSVFRASRSGGFFRFVLLATLFFCMFPLTYMIMSLEPSNSCGPYRTQDRVYKVLTDRIGDAPDWLRTVVVYISTPAVVIPVVILLTLLVFYYRVKSSTQRKTARNIRVQFKMKRQLEKKQLFSKNRIQRAIC